MEKGPKPFSEEKAEAIMANESMAEERKMSDKKDIFTLHIDALPHHYSAPKIQAQHVLKKKDMDEIIVVDDSYNPVGIVTDEDILTKISESLVNPSKTTLGDIMVFPLISI